MAAPPDSAARPFLQSQMRLIEIGNADATDREVEFVIRFECQGLGVFLRRFSLRPYGFISRDTFDLRHSFDHGQCVGCCADMWYCKARDFKVLDYGDRFCSRATSIIVDCDSGRRGDFRYSERYKCHELGGVACEMSESGCQSCEVCLKFDIAPRQGMNLEVHLQ